jgi:hypothetical protein
MNTEAANKQLIEQFDSWLKSGNHDGLERFCKPDMVNHALAPSRPAGLAGTREVLESRVSRGLRLDSW